LFNSYKYAYRQTNFSTFSFSVCFVCHVTTHKNSSNFDSSSVHVHVCRVFSVHVLLSTSVCTYILSYVPTYPFCRDYLWWLYTRALIMGSFCAVQQCKPNFILFWMLNIKQMHLHKPLSLDLKDLVQCNTHDSCIRQFVI